MSEHATTEWSDPYMGQYNDGYVVVPEGIKLHYTEWNPSGKQCVMLIHGLGVQLHTWDPIASILSRKFRVICPDLRGHGDSEWSRRGYQTERFCEDIHAIAQALNAAPFTWVGHSLGSRIGFAYGGLYPHDVTSLLLCDTAPEMPRSAALYASRIVGGSADIKGFNSHDEAAGHFRKIHPEWKPEFYDLHAKYHLRRNWAGKLVIKSDPDVYWITRGAGLKEIPFLWAQAGRITKPVLLVWPEQSAFFDDDLISRLKQTIPGDVTLARPNTGHYLPRENPELMADIIAGFVSASASRR